MMEVSYDIYRQMEERKLRWIARVEGLDRAHERIDRLELSNPGHYLIYDFRQGAVVPHLVAHIAV
jgi:hypothetical protein